MTTWLIAGNSNIDSTKFLGTTNPQPLIIKTNNKEAMRVSSTDGDVSIGEQGATRSPDYKLDVQGILNADDIYKGGSQLVGSQWEDVTDDGISYGAGNVGVGKAPAANYKLDVAGILNATDYHKNGSALISSQWQDVSGGISYTAGNVGVGKAPAANYKLDVAGTLNATDYHKNGSALISSQWQNVSGGISYTAGNVGVGKASSTSYKLDVAGTLNATDYHKNGSALISSQWQNVSGGISYTAGNVGVGKASSTSYKLDVAGTLNATDYHKNGSALISSQWQNVSGGISYTAGNVGVGKAPAANYKLDVAGTLNATDYHKNGSALISSQWQNVSGGISYSTGETQYHAMFDGLTIDTNYRTPLVLRLKGASPTEGGIWKMEMAYGGLTFAVNTSRKGDFSSALLVLQLSHTGDVQITRDLTVHLGNAYKPGGGSWSSRSDVQLKKSVRPLKDALGKLLQLRGVSFEWKEPEKQGNLTGPQMGLIAQEVQEVFPEWIDSDPSGYKILTVRGFEALAVEALKEIKAENEALRSRIEALETI